jgi:RecG-like helicase
VDWQKRRQGQKWPCLFRARQSGLPDFRVANFVRDIQLLNEARKEAFGVIAPEPILSLPELFL